MLIGANPLCWMNSDFPNIPNQASVEQCLKEIAEIGYIGVELEDPFVDKLKQLPSWLKEKKLSCIGKWHSTFILENDLETEMNKLHKHMDMLESLNSEVVILSECSFAVQQQKEAQLSKRPLVKNWNKLCDGLEKMAQEIKKRGFKSTYHHHMGTCIQTSDDIDTLMKNTVTLGLLFDSGHLAFAQADPQEVLEKHIDRITHVHCKNIREDVLREKLEIDSSFYSAVLDGVFTVPGDGQGIDFKKFLKTLKSNEYKGWIVMEAEQDPSKADPYTYAKLGFDSLESLLEDIKEPLKKDKIKL